VNKLFTQEHLEKTGLLPYDAVGGMLAISMLRCCEFYAPLCRSEKIGQSRRK